MFKLQPWRGKFKNKLTRFVWTSKIIGENVCIQDNAVQEEYKFPFAWLRDNCQCSECFHSTSNSRTIDVEKFKFDVKPQTMEVSESGLKVTWSDDHSSDYTLPWLKHHRFSSKHQKHWLDNVYRLRPKPWKAKEFSRILQGFYFQEILEREDVLLSWLECLAIWGVALVKDAGVQEGTLLQLCDRVSFAKRTQYGELFSVKAKPGTSNVAYLNGPLQLHTDLPYYEYKPGVIMLHCLVHAEDKGGENQLSDGLAVYTDLKQNHPKDFQILSNTLVDWSDIVEEDGRQYYSLYRAPVFSANSFGDLVRMSFSQPQRDSHFNIPLEQVIPWYKAFKIFTRTLHSSDFKVLHRLKQGDVLTFNNLRLAHGRCSYEGERHLQGGYLDWDHIYSQIRVLRRLHRKD